MGRVNTKGNPMLDIPNSNYEPQIVFSVPDAATAVRLVGYMDKHNLPYLPVIGAWRGEPRPHSFVAHATAFGPLLQNDFFAGSESLLYLHPQRSRDGGRRAELLTLPPVGSLKCPAEDYGFWHAVSENAAKSRPGYTYDPATNVYYTCLYIPTGNEKRKEV
jgi:hypothetical protein